MIVDRRIWEVASEAINAERERKLKRLLSGTCEAREYGSICGFISGLEFFEIQLTEARSPKKKEADDDERNSDES